MLIRALLTEQFAEYREEIYCSHYLFHQVCAQLELSIAVPNDLNYEDRSEVRAKVR